MQTRRDFVRSLALASLAAGVPWRLHAAESTSPRKIPQLPPAGAPREVLIVGAGLAGLCSAHLLYQAGYRVTLVEARTRPGGRIQTASAPFADGLYGELGPARIPAAHARVRSWIAYSGQQLERFDPTDGERLDVVRGKKIRYPHDAPPKLNDYPWAFTAEELKLGAGGVAERWEAPFRRIGGDVLGSKWPPQELQRYDAMNTREYVRSCGLSEAVDQYLGLGFDDPSGSHFSALWLYRLAILGPFNEPFARVRGGMARLPDALAQGLAGRIRYGTALVAMSQDESGVSAVVEHNGQRETLKAQRAIVTAPFPPLRDVAFTPALSRGKQRAIQEMQYENLARVLLQLGSRPWEKDGLAGWARTDLPSELWHLSYDRQGPRALYGVYLKGAAAFPLLRMNEAERIRYAAAHVETIFPGVAAAVEGGISKVWMEDRWAGGAHASLAPGQLTALMPHAALAEGRIHFAGEHTSPWQGWMEGAVESGERGAQEVAELLRPA